MNRESPNISCLERGRNGARPLLSPSAAKGPCADAQEPSFRSYFVEENRENQKGKASKPKVKLATKSSHAAYFMPMLESFAEHDVLNEVIKSRVVKSCDILDSGVPLFPNDFRQKTSVAEVFSRFDSLSPEELEGQQEAVEGLAGRIVSLRSFGKVIFFQFGIKCRTMKIIFSYNIFS